MSESKLNHANEKIKNTVVSGYRKIEEGVVDGYKKIENGVVGGYKKMEEGVVSGFEKVSDHFVEKFFTCEGESVEEAKQRLAQQAAHGGMEESPAHEEAEDGGDGAEGTSVPKA